MDTNRRIKELLTKTEHYDADERFMATNDLIKELEKVSGFLDASLQAPVRAAVLKMLDDKGKDMSTIAVKCLSTLVQKFEPDQVIAIVDKLAQSAVDAKSDESSRDTFCDGIRNCIAVVDFNTGKLFAVPLLTTLMKGLKSKDASVQMLCMDVVKDLLEKYGSELLALHADLLKALSDLLASDNDAVRKRASVTLGPLVTYLDEKEFNGLMNLIIKNIEGRNPDVYIQCVGVTSKAAGTRVGEFLPKIVPPLAKYCKTEASTPQATVELWQNCLKAFEFIITRCPNKVTDYVRGIVEIALDMLSYDPNVVKEVAIVVEGDDGEDWGEDGGEGWGDDGGAKGGGGWDDAADVVEANAADESWKVRLAAAGVLSAFIRCRSDILKSYYMQLCDALVTRYAVERDAAVCEELLQATKDLLRESIVSVSSGGSTDMELDEDMPMPLFVRTRSSYETLENKVSQIVDGICKIFDKSSPPIQKAALGVLRELVTVRRGNLEEYFAQIMPHILFGVRAGGKSVTLNQDALVLLRLVISFHDAQKLGPYLAQITEATVAAVAAVDVQIKPEALKTVAAIAKVLPRVQASEPLVMMLYKTTLSLLVLKDTHQATKTASIHTMAIILAHFGQILPGAVKEVLPVYNDRLGNEVTRETTLRAITKIAHSEAKFDLSYLAQNSVKEIVPLMRQASQRVRHQTAKCLEALVRGQAAKISPADFQAMLSELALHLEDSDLLLCHLTFEAVSTCLSTAPAVAPQVAADILPRTIKLLHSPLLQGESLRSLIKFFKACCVHGGKVPALSFDALLKTLLGVVSENSSKSTFIAVSQCVAGIALQEDKKTAATVTQFVNNIKGSASDPIKEVSLLAVGEIGKQKDLGTHADIEKVINGAFSSKNGNVQKAAAFAFGALAVGNLPKFLPVLLTYVTTSPEQYLVLSALKEAIGGTQSSAEHLAAFGPFIATVTPLLFERAEAKEEGTRVMASECLGRLAILDGQRTIPALAKLTTSSNEKARQTAVAALRFAFTPELSWGLITAHLGEFAKLLQDPSLQVRQQAVLTFNSLFNSNIGAITTELLKDSILPSLYSETKAHPELVHLVDYGNFKENVDDGLPLRKSVFMCLSSLLENGAYRLDMQLFMKQLIGGLTDNDDIQIISLQMFETIARIQPGPLLEILDSLPNTIMDSVKNHLKVAKTPEGERSMDCLRAIVKALTVFNKVPGHEMCAQYNRFYKQVLATALLKEILQKQMSS